MATTMSPATLPVERSLLDFVWDKSLTGIRRRRRQVQIVLGGVWLLDAALQFQPFMFGRSFVTRIMEAGIPGNPGVVRASLRHVDHLVARHIGSFNTFFFVIQLVIAIGILLQPTIKPALVLSLAWALGVWYFGESAGGVFIGLTPVMGFPGAVLLYGLIALYAWPTTGRDSAASVAESGLLGSRAPRVLWALLWAVSARTLLLANNRAPGALAEMVGGMSAGEPAWLRTLDLHLGNALNHHGTEVSLVLAALCSVVAVTILLPRGRPSYGWLVKAGLGVAVILAALFWVGQNFGALFSGTGTDPNSGPLLVILAATLWPITSPARPTGG